MIPQGHLPIAARIRSHHLFLRIWLPLLILLAVGALSERSYRQRDKEA